MRIFSRISNKARQAACFRHDNLLTKIYLTITANWLILVKMEVNIR